MEYTKLSTAEQEQELAHVLKEYNDYKAKGLKLDMSRGKPGSDQLDLCMGMMDTVTSTDEVILPSGIDVRNYGPLDGIPEIKELFCDMFTVTPEQLIIGGNSSLTLMYDTIAKAMLFGVSEGSTPWIKQGDIKFICVVPGYDRHFAICEAFGIQMINVKMNADGPDMDTIEKLVSSDESIKGIWCVPKYSNPDGTTYSDEVVSRFANLNPLAKDFRIFWDNAYNVHNIEDKLTILLSIFNECKKSGKQDMVVMFGSTSKISFSGAGIAIMASSEQNIAYMKKLLTVQTIGFDKVNQLRHIKFFKDMDGVLAHMEKHRQILKPKFEMVATKLNENIKPLGIATWNDPKGGYFVSVDTMEGCAKRTVELCKEAGVVLTAAGATYPYGKDPHDSNIRIAPTYPPVSELEVAMDLFCISLKVAALEKLLGKR